MIATRGPDITTPKVGRPSVDSKRESMESPMYEFIKDRLYFTTSGTRRFDTPSMHFFNVNNTLVYIPFFSDFGPMNVAHIYRFCLILHGKLESKQLAHKRIIFYSDPENTKRTNSAFLLCAYMIIVLGKSPDQAFAPLENVTPPFLQFRDAGYGPCTYQLSVLDCLRGLYKGLSLRLLRLDEFDVEEYEFYERVENGDFNWLTPKFIAFASPSDDTPPSPTSNSTSRPQTAFPALLSYFKSGDIKVVVRLNNKLYDEQKFTELGIQHEELYFPDGTCPPDIILRRFLRLCEETDGVIAVHCKAGLGRTGTLIAAYLMKHYRFTAAEVISFLRIMRPGSVVGPQQNYLASIEKRCWQMGEEERIRNNMRSAAASPTSASRRNSTRRATESNNSPARRRVEKKAPENEQVQAASVPAVSENSTPAAVLDQVELALANARKNKRHSSDGSAEAMNAMGEERLTIGVPVQPRKKLLTPERLAIDKIDVPMTREARVRTFSGTAQAMEREKERMLRERKERDEREKKEILEKAKEAERNINTNAKGAKNDMEISRSDVSMAGSDVSMANSKVDVPMGEPVSLMGKSAGTSTISSASTASSVSTISTTPSSATSAIVATRSGSMESSSAAAAASAAASKTKIWKRSSRPTPPPATSTNTSSTIDPRPSSPVTASHRQSRYNLRSNTGSTQPSRDRSPTRSPTPTQAPPLNRKQSSTSTLSLASSITSNTTAASGRRSPISSVTSIKNGVRSAVANATKKASNSMRRVVSMSVLPRGGNNSSSSAGTTGPVPRR